MLSAFELKNCSDQQLLIGAKVLVGSEREATAQLIAHLGEIDARRLFLNEGCSSLFKYCTEVLHLSESAAYNRIEVARAARKFPVILEKLAEGAIHLSALRTLAPCLTPENHLGLLEAAKHKSRDEVERIAVRVRPRPDVPSVIRKLPEQAAAVAAISESETGLFGGIAAGTGVSEGPNGGGVAVAVPAHTVTTPRRQAAVSALSPGRYKIEFTADEKTYEALRQLQELLRHQVPNGDVATIIGDALLLRLAQVKHDKLAQVDHPRKRKVEETELWVEEREQPNGDAHSEPSTTPRDSRHIPAEVKRSVWQRDQGQCAFMGKNGRRCSERGRLEFHHVHAYALGGPATIDNIALRCRAHNAHESRPVFADNGKELTCPRTSSAGERSSGKGPEGGRLLAHDSRRVTRSARKDRGRG